MRRATATENAHGPARGFLREFGDLGAVLAYALTGGFLVLSGVVEGPMRVLVAGPLLFFLPGYAVVAALFPAEPPDGGGDGTVLSAAVLRRPGVEWVERVALSLAVSVVVLVLLALALSLAGSSFATAPLVTVVVALTAVAALAAGGLRARLAPGDRATAPVDRWHDEARAATVDAGSGVDAALNVALAVAVVAAVAALAVGLAAPQSGEAYTEAALLTESDGKLVAGDYPTDLTAGEPASFTLVVENHEGAATDYTTVVVLQRVQTDGESVSVLEQQELGRESLSLGDGERAQQAVSVTPDLLGEDLRLRVLVYAGDPPAEPTGASATEHLTLWVDVSPADGA
ncbi:DUF1616 domain-containing protein [Halobacterium jilantaiense]|uniref:Uncharacterized membrane protein n=1 Tax=Halobacterium jilantaiense TaxID=355548 RepID=A0A1I0MQE2_9EURY|nr:DUF1616 domain-containing protein [Halobacterium jilantaiense]SEV90758.1 Uncharacterized membrane protein [Halobacterium jilantaiense]